MRGAIYINPVDGYEMVYIPAGAAVFGSAQDDPDGQPNEKPQFAAELPAYYLGLCCVTNAQYAKFLTTAAPSQRDLERWIELGSCCHVVKGGGGYVVDDEEGHADHPVVMVSWYGAQAYCEWAGLRLPTELEWEKAARDGDGRKYCWGNQWDASRCRYDGNRVDATTCCVRDYEGGISWCGLYNMIGNVWEWCADWYEERAYERYAKGDLRAPDSGQYKVLRGGSWYGDDPADFRCAYRDSYEPSVLFFNHGFRCARDP